MWHGFFEISCKFYRHMGDDDAGGAVMSNLAYKRYFTIHILENPSLIFAMYAVQEWEFFAPNRNRHFIQ